jgi:hypothetical protein
VIVGSPGIVIDDDGLEATAVSAPSTSGVAAVADATEATHKRRERLSTARYLPKLLMVLPT